MVFVARTGGQNQKCNARWGLKLIFFRIIFRPPNNFSYMQNCSPEGCGDDIFSFKDNMKKIVQNRGFNVKKKKKQQAYMLFPYVA